MITTATMPAIMKLLRRFDLRAAAVYRLSGGDESCAGCGVVSGTERDAFSSAMLFSSEIFFDTLFGDSQGANQ